MLRQQARVKSLAEENASSARATISLVRRKPLSPHITEIDSWLRRTHAAQTPRQLLLNSGSDGSAQVPPTFGKYSICENHDLSLHGVGVHAASSCRRSLSSLPTKSCNARMRATSVTCTAPAPVFPLFSITCVGVLLARPLPYQHAKAQRSALLGRVYVTDSRIRSQVGWMVSRAAIPQGIQLRGLCSIRPVASTWLTVRDTRYEHSLSFFGFHRTYTGGTCWHRFVQ